MYAYQCCKVYKTVCNKHCYKILKISLVKDIQWVWDMEFPQWGPGPWAEFGDLYSEAGEDNQNITVE